MKVIGRSLPSCSTADLVGADVLGDATGLALTHAGVTDGVEQSGLAVVDVTHDGDDRRTDLEIVLAALVLAVGEVERLQQFAVFVLGGHDLHDVVHLAAEQFEGFVTDRLGGGHHLAEVEQRLNQCSRVGVDLLGEVHQRRAAGETDGLAIAVRQPDATDDGRLHVLVFGAFRPLRLATALRRATGTTERTCGSAALTWASAATAAAGTTAIACARWGTATGACTGAATGATAAVVTAAATTAAAGDDHLGPHRGHDRRDLAGHRRRRGDRWEPGEAHRASGACCPATYRAWAYRAAEPLGGAPADAESAGQPAEPRRTGCCRRAVCARRAWVRLASGPASGQGSRQVLEPVARVPRRGPQARRPSLG